jgi:hypothetical protein
VGRCGLEGGLALGIPWSAQFPIVNVPQSAEPKRFTLVLPYYDNPQFLKTQIHWWGTYPPHLRAHLSAIVVDDGSPLPAAPVLEHCAQPFPIRLFRIGVDCRWNWLAARNIGAHEAADGWILLTDMDHMLPASTADALIYGQHDPSVVYAFSRIEHTGEAIAPHSASFFMTKQMFWKIGGYEERFSGFYGTDGRYRKRLVTTAPLMILSDRLVRHEFEGDSSTSTYGRKQAVDARVAKIAAQIPKGAKPRVLSFPYAEVAL